MDELLTEIQGYLNQENDTSDFELYHELDCQICADAGHSDCQGHYYSDDTGYID